MDGLEGTLLDRGPGNCLIVQTSAAATSATPGHGHYKVQVCRRIRRRPNPGGVSSTSTNLLPETAGHDP